MCLSELVLADPDTTIINETAALSPASDMFRSLFFYRGRSPNMGRFFKTAIKLRKTL